jgi:hypothetical protein
VVPTVVFPKLIAETPTWRLPFPFLPVQVSEALCVIVASLSVKTTVAASDPAVTGLQLIVAAQLPPGRTVPQL